jgi:TetR/AcrR family transcriptional regulator
MQSAAAKKQTKGEATRQAILDAAETVFAELGFSSARLEDVAQAVGIKRASIVYYFRGKQELYDAVEADIFALLHSNMQTKLARASDPLDRFLAVIDAWLDYMVSRPTAARIIQRVTADVTPRADDPVKYSDFSLTSIEAIVRDGKAVGLFGAADPMMLMNIFGGAILNYVCNAEILGPNRTYKPGNSKNLSLFRATLHSLAHAIIADQPKRR